MESTFDALRKSFEHLTEKVREEVKKAVLEELAKRPQTTEETP